MLFLAGRALQREHQSGPNLRVPKEGDTYRQLCSKIKNYNDFGFQNFQKQGYLNKTVLLCDFSQVLENTG